MRSPSLALAMILSLLALRGGPFEERNALAQMGGAGAPPSGVHETADDDEEAPSAEPAPLPPGAFRAPRDIVTEDRSRPPGTVSVYLRDPDDHPIANETVMMAVINNSVAKGEARKHFSATTDADGVATFSGQSAEGNPAIRVSVARGGGTFGVTPFQLQDATAMKVVLHAYPVTHEINDTMLLIEVATGVELKDDRIQFEQAVQLVNVGKNAWVPNDAFVTLPAGFTALTAQPVMGGSQAILPVEGKGAQIVGTFGPGQHELTFRWQLPWSNEETVSVALGVPARTVVQRVVASAARGMELELAGAPAAQARTLQSGQKILVTERQFQSRSRLPDTMSFELRHLPVRGPGAQIALAIATGGVLIGLYVALTQRRWKTQAASDSEQLLAELGALEDAHAAGDVGPKTYEKARRRIIQGLARAMAETPA